MTVRKMGSEMRKIGYKYKVVSYQAGNASWGTKRCSPVTRLFGCLSLKRLKEKEFIDRLHHISYLLLAKIPLVHCVNAAKWLCCSLGSSSSLEKPKSLQCAQPQEAELCSPCTAGYSSSNWGGASDHRVRRMERWKATEERPQLSNTVITKTHKVQDFV